MSFQKTRKMNSLVTKIACINILQYLLHPFGKKVFHCTNSDYFPNIEIALRMYLLLNITNSIGEKSFLKLKSIKKFTLDFHAG